MPNCLCDAQQGEEGRKDGLSSGLKKLCSPSPEMVRRGSSSCKEERRAKKGRKKAFGFNEAEVELFSGSAETEYRGKGVWYPEEPDRDIWGG